MSRAIAADPYTHAGFVPVADELRGVTLAIEGDLPREIDGLFLRNGPNALFAPRRRHMFDGEAMVHAIELKGGEARYSNSIIRTPRTRWIERAGRNPFVGVADLTRGGKGAMLRLLAERWKTRLGLMPRFTSIEAGANSTAILHHGDRLYCLQETALPFRLDLARNPEGWLTMEGGGAFETFGDHLTFPFSAHPKIDPRTGAAHSISNDIMTGTIRHTRIDADGTARSAKIGQSRPPPFFVHDFVLADDLLVFPDTSLRFDPAGLVRGDASAAGFDRDHKLRFGLIAGDAPVRWFETDRPGHIWHIANGWQADGAIHLYAPVFRDYPATIPIHTPAEPHAQFVHWRLDLATGAVGERVLLDEHYERPGIDWRGHGRPSRYVWLLDQGGGVMGRGVLKYDLIEERAAGYLDYGGLLGGEPVFVPRADAQDGDEDAGWLLDLVADGDRAVLIVIDAATMVERCRIPLPQRVPFGVHALWLDRAETDRLIAA